MRNTAERPAIPSALATDKADTAASPIVSLLNQAIKRAQRGGPADELRLILNQAIRAIAQLDTSDLDQSQLQHWQEVLQQLEIYFVYLKESEPQAIEDPNAPGSWSSSWSGRDDNGVV